MKRFEILKLQNQLRNRLTQNDVTFWESNSRTQAHQLHSLKMELPFNYEKGLKAEVQFF